MSISGIGSGVSSFLAPTPRVADATSAALPADKAKELGGSAKEDFLKFAQMSPADLLRAQILGEMGLKEEDLNRMDSKTRKEVEDKIKDQIKQAAEKSAPGKTGLLVDISA
ncbi:hypothetical protein [Flaviflagellibacter deserti]|uniref:Uncharacterized protein n=1 Tax=Flaviflagellibacter deserti TaxID=2267266 RepID=A0ABV9Z4P9_9HYPH